jgi:hypothetical protein
MNCVWVGMILRQWELSPMSQFNMVNDHIILHDLKVCDNGYIGINITLLDIIHRLVFI